MQKILASYGDAQFQVLFIMTTSCLVSNYRATKKQVGQGRLRLWINELGTPAFSYIKLGNCSVLTILVPPDSTVDAAAMACLALGILASLGIFQPFKQSNRHNSCSSFDQSQLALLAHSWLVLQRSVCGILGEGIWPDLVDNYNNVGADGID